MAKNRVKYSFCLLADVLLFSQTMTECFLSTNLVARLVKSWATRAVRHATLFSNKIARQSFSTCCVSDMGLSKFRLQPYIFKQMAPCRYCATTPICMCSGGVLGSNEVLFLIIVISYLNGIRKYSSQYCLLESSRG